MARDSRDVEALFPPVALESDIGTCSWNAHYSRGPASAHWHFQHSNL